MGTKPTYEELEQRVKELEQEAVLHERATEALLESEKRFRRIVEDTEAGYFFVDIEGRFMDVNEAWLRMHGFSSRDEAIGQHFSITQVDEDLEAAQRIVERLLRGNTIPAGAFSRRCKDGSVGYHIFSASPVESDGKIVGLKGFLIDVTEHRLEEEDLHQSNGEWEKAFNSISDWVCLIDLNSRILRTNIGGEKFVNVPADEMFGQTCCKLVHGSDKPIAGCPLQRMLETHQRETVELQTADGSWLMVTADPVMDKEGQLVGAVHITRDVTDRKQTEEALSESMHRMQIAYDQSIIYAEQLKEEIAKRKKTEEALRKSEEQMQAILDASVDMIMQVDTGMRIVWANRTAAAVINKAPEDLVGHTCHKFFQNADSPCPGCPCKKALETGNIEHGIMFQPAMNTVGESYWEDYGVPIKDESGKVVGVIEIARNVTEQKRAEAALRESEEKYRTQFDEALDAIFIADAETGVLVDCNHAASVLVGRTKSEIVDKHQSILHPTEKVEGEFSRTFKEHLEDKEGQTLDAQVITKDGEIRDVAIKTNIFEMKGRRFLQGIFRDITYRRRAEEEKKKLEVKLLQAQKMEAIATLAGGIAHDFNNLLTGIQGNVSLMFLDIDTTHPHYERLKSIKKQVHSGARLTSQLLGYARKGKYEVKPVDLNHLVQETSESFGRMRKDISIHRQLKEELFTIEADPGQIEQVLWNLFVNAADAMPGGGDLILKTDHVTHEDMKGKLYDPKPGNYVLLAVTDTGAGMSKDTMERIFDPFFTTKEMGRGTGLGLASVYGIVKGHAGYIEVESEKSVGTTFSIFLPSSKKKVQKVVKAAQEVIEGTETVLLIDDEEVILEVGKHLLEAMGYRVLTARDGKEAVEIYKDNRDKIDLVILDMVMPHMGGGEAYDKMKEISPNVKVVLSSGYSIESQAKEILARGCDAFIQKPFGIRELSQKIRGVLQKK